MKRYFRTALAAVASLLIAPMMTNANPAADGDGHVLTALWNKYEAAVKADRPQTEADLLSQIKREAQGRRLPVDFYDAATGYVETVQRRDWKQRDALRKQLREEVEAFDDPMVTFLWMGDHAGSSTDERWAYVKPRAEAFRAAHHPAFYRSIGSLMGGEMEDFIASDYEYVLWRLFLGRYYDNPDGDEIYTALRQEVAGKYPGEGYLAYYVANRKNGRVLRKAALEPVAARYAGKAVSLWPRKELLQIEFERLQEEKSGAAGYEKLYAACQAYEKERAALKGDEAKIARGCTSVSSLAQTLTSKNVDVQIVNKEAVVTFRNLDKATLTLREDKKTLKTWNLTNPVRSFYVMDTVRVALPALGDGSYMAEVTSGRLSDLAWYNQHSLSLAVRKDSRGYAAYVTDYLSGQPLGKAKLVLWKGDREVASETVSLDGFTLLPPKFLQTIGNKDNVYYSLTAETGSGTKRRASESLMVHSYSDYFSTYREKDGIFCQLYKDRGAYNPGDELQFKAIVYQGNLVDRVSVVPDMKVRVLLLNAESKEIGKKELKTNEFGSVSGSFTLPKGQRNGRFYLRVEGAKGHLASDSFTVDEFVLPTFSLSFDRNEKLYLKGDEIEVKGSVRSYSGHSLTGATLSARVERWGQVYLEQSFSPQEDGTFRFAFPAEDTGYYQVTVTVTDATGEMQEFYTGYYVSDYIRINLSVENGAEGEYVTLDERSDPYPVFRGPGRRAFYSFFNHIVTEGATRVSMTVRNSNGDRIDAEVRYRLKAEDGSEVRTGSCRSGETVSIDLQGLPDGLYTLAAESAERGVKDDEKCCILKVDPDGAVLDAPLRRLFLTGPEDVPLGGKIRLTMGTADGAEWAIVTLFGKERTILETRKIQLKGVRGEAGSLTRIEFDYKADYPDAVRLQVFYFKRGEAITFDKEYSRSKTRLALPLAFNRFEDKAFPGVSLTFSLKTEPDVEGLAAVYDKSIDAIEGNDWPRVYMREFTVPYVSVDAVCGRIHGDNPYEKEIVAYAEDAAPMMATGSANIMLAKTASRAAMPESEALADSALEVDAAAPAEVTVRSQFENALTFQPHLRSDAEGNLTFTFETSDKLSTYYVAVYAHDKGMRNAYVREEMVVSVPVKVAVVEPQFLYAGDTYEVAASVSSNTDEEKSGWLYLYTYPSESWKDAEPLSVQRVAVTVPAGGTVSHRFPVRIPAVETLGLKVVFAASEFSDAVFLPVPVQKPVQRLTESHSAVLLPGMSRETLLSDLQGRFVNVPASEAALTETSLIDLVRAAIPAKVIPSGKDVLSLSEAYYVRLLAGRLDSSAEALPDTEELLEKVLSCRNADGGFAWFEGMDSSPIITAVLLDRFAKLRDHGFAVPDLSSSVKFLDDSHFSESLPYWRGYLSDAQYLYVRSLYAAVPFQVAPVTTTGKKCFAQFKKYAKGYLVPSAKDGRGLQGQIMAKARRVQTLLNLSASAEGVALAKGWGVTVAAKARMEKSLKADIASLREYAVAHRDGGWYYPNAVMPWRGLMETEADAHALLCGLLQPYDGKISDGIRLWLMLQKETQKWDETPSYVDALTAILDGSQEILSTTILSYSASYEKPFAGIKAAGNGFTIERKFFREKTQEQLYDDRTSDKNDFVTVREEIRPGTPVAVGDKILVEYRIWNAENRSFVKVDAFREAALRPVEQLSGYTGWRWGRRGLSFTPQGYRNVKADRSEYFFDAFPEEKTTLTEEFFVTQAGTFTAPVVTVESLYAPHYRANDAFHGVLSVSDGRE